MYRIIMPYMGVAICSHTPNKGDTRGLPPHNSNCIHSSDCTCQCHPVSSVIGVVAS